MFTPKEASYSVDEWRTLPFGQRLQWVCREWAQFGYGVPAGVYLFYLAKLGIYVAAWLWFCSQTAELGPMGEVLSWYAKPAAFQKAVLFSMLFEVLGLGCGSGPLTGRYLPPVGGFLYFARVGTTKLPFWSRLPLVGGTCRGLVDVLAYLALVVFLVRGLLAETLAPDMFWIPLLLLFFLGLCDKAIFLAARSEHYAVALFCFLFPSAWLAGCKLLWVAVWMWAAASKLNAHFPSVVCVMQSNSPLTRWGSFRKSLYRSFPDDLRPSRTATAMAHGGTLLEFSFPLVLLFQPSSEAVHVGLWVMLGFHLFITSSIPMGVPIEWNAMMVYGALVLFGAHGGVAVASLMAQPILLLVLAFCLLVVPLYGNLRPKAVSFLLSMRYYAGNWPYSVWLFRGDAAERLDRCIKKSSPRVQKQLRVMYDEDTITVAMSKVMAFRAMHLQGRALQLLLPKTVDDLDDYEYLDGEIVAGMVLGYNFGDGHLHQEQLLEAVQAACGFEEGELRCLFVESQALGSAVMPYRIVDAKTGELSSGELSIQHLLELQPWPEAAGAELAP